MENEVNFQILPDYDFLIDDFLLQPSEYVQQIQPVSNISSSSCSSSNSCEININSKIERRKMLNRKAAARLRQKKKKEIKELQSDNDNLKNEIGQMNCTIKKLKKQLMELEGR
ncbi:14334_t:CDS:2 [Funneliformis geosporum]|uniref:11197_t:CDS:1 n=1 Tax=Funneliformis geosporum TaxID=1117311 RepID=A0A9W4SRD4_9GLOM|nr:14334_t:CDS:2 [Funneliformis geosporum]CAI2178122.1 11197_t:CDS:2 [Funneliformis geosporum]